MGVGILPSSEMTATQIASKIAELEELVVASVRITDKDKGLVIKRKDGSADIRQTIDAGNAPNFDEV